MSMSGYTNRKYASLGFVHLLNMADILKTTGFQLWDMGMQMDYKADMGAKPIPRKLFLQFVRKFRNESNRLSRSERITRHLRHKTPSHRL